MIRLCKAIANSETFQALILCLILFAAAIMAFETQPQLLDQLGLFFEFFFYFSQAVFVFEILIRILSYYPKLRHYFRDFWNTFDFTIVFLSLLPGVGSFILVARLLRLLRVLRIMSVSDKLRAFSFRLGEVLDEILYGVVVLAIFAYMFTISGFYLFSEIDPSNWGSLSRSFLSVFYLSLLQDVKGFLEPLFQQSATSLFFFIVFYMVLFGFALSILNAAISQSLEKGDAA